MRVLRGGEIIDENGCTHSLDDPEIQWFHNVFHEGNRSHKEWLMRLLTGGNFFLGSSSLIRAELVQKIGGQNLSLIQLQDFEYWIRVLSHSDVHIICEELTKYRRVKNGNSLSAVNDITRRRSVNESIYICNHFFDYISDELFISLFKDEFRYRDSSSTMELACEKAFLLEKAFCGAEPALVNLQKLLSDNESAKILSEKFGYTQKDFYKANIESRYFDQIVCQRFLDKESECQQLREKVNCAQNEIERLNAENQNYCTQLNGVLLSKSWRITKPLRAFCQWIRSNR